MALSMDDYPDVFTIPADLFPTTIKAIPLESMGIKVFLAFITADIAETLLKNKNKNRTIHLSQLNKVKRSIERGRWEINGETIIFDAHGRLIEGQHRLKAVVDTGIGIWTLIVHGIDFERFNTMGQGSKRTAGDILGINGEKDARLLAAALRWVYRYENDQMNNPHPTVNDDEVADTLKFHLNPISIIDSIPFGRRCHGIAAPGMCIALHYLCKKRNATIANDFFWKLGTGELLEKGDVIMVLRNRFLESVTKKQTRLIIRDEPKAHMIALAWNIIRQDGYIKLKDSRRIASHKKVGQKFPKLL